MVSDIHPQSKQGFNESTSDDYDKARPSYPADVLLHLYNNIESSAPLNVIEIGSGTGLFTRALLSHPVWSAQINELRAVEPSEGMRATFAKKTDMNCGKVSLAAGTFDNIPAPEGWADLIVIAQAFHWCLDFEAALDEFIRVLKPTGVVSFIWNSEDEVKTSWVSELRKIRESYDKKKVFHDYENWRGIFDLQRYAVHFKPSEEKVFEYCLPATAELVTSRVLTWSPIAVLDEDEKKRVKEKVAKILEGGELVWSDRENGVFEFPYETLVVILKRS